MPYIFPYNSASDSAKKLSETLGFKRIKTEGSKFKGSGDKIVINWGNSRLPEEVEKCKVINKPEAVAIAANKLTFFDHITSWNEKHKSFADGYVKTPLHTTSQDSAINWLMRGFDVVCRTVLNGHSGEGIVLVEHNANLIPQVPRAPLYVRYVKKKAEYRVHVVGGEVKDVVRKARRQDVPDDQINWKIRNHQNGFVFSRNEALGNVPPSVFTNAVNAVNACGLDFGAVDVIYNESTGNSYVLEINSAPGMEGETVGIYANAFLERLVKLGNGFNDIPNFDLTN